MFIFLWTNSLLAQAPDIDWQKSIGGAAPDIVRSISSTNDGGYIISGQSTSNISGDKSENVIGGVQYDYWIVKTDNIGNIIWENTIGGTNIDDCASIVQTADGGYLLAGESISPISGDKTAVRKGGFDYWVVKINADGIVVWNKTYGGNNFDKLRCVVEVPDGFMLGGFSGSDISGDKTTGNFGLNDYWLVKIDFDGNFIWDKTYGGDGDEGIGYDNSLKLTPDGGFIMAGFSYSGISGNKTEPCLSPGIYDCWIIKTDADGNMEWQNTIGGNSIDVAICVENTNDGGYIIGASSGSSISGDKTESNIGQYDYWIIKLNAEGVMEWQNTIGGTLDDQMAAVIEDASGNFVLGGYSFSEISGDKAEASFGEYDYWIIKINTTGSILWQKVIGGALNETLYDIIGNTDGSITLGGFSNSGISGNKTVDTHGVQDFYIVTLIADCTPISELCNSLDDNCNGIIDDGITETISISAGGSTTFCQGGNVLLTATYSGAAVQWKKNGTNIPGAISPTYLVTAKGTYTCETTSACDTELSTGIFVNVLKNPPATITAGGATTFCAGGSVTLTETPVAGCSYQWYKGASFLVGATSTNYIATVAGNYKCRVTKTATGCFKNSNAISVSVPCKEGESSNDENVFSIYPNPNNGTFTIEANLKTQDYAFPESTLEIYNNLGQLIFSKDVISKDGIINETINMEYIIPGIYLVKLCNNNIQNVKNIIIE